MKSGVAENVVEMESVETIQEQEPATSKTRIIQNQAPPVKVGKLKLPDLESVRGSAVKPEALKDVKVDPENKPIELKPYVVSSAGEIRANKRKRETVTTKVETEEEYYVVRQTDPRTGKFLSTGIKLPIDDARVETLLSSKLEMRQNAIEKFHKNPETGKGFLELGHIYKDDDGITHTEVKYFKLADGNAKEIVDLLAASVDKSLETDEQFLVSAETVTLNGEQITVETLTPIAADSPKRKFKTNFEKDNFVEVTRVLKNTEGKSYEEVKTFQKGDPEIENFTEGLTILSSTTVSEKYTKTKVQEIRSEVTSTENDKSLVRVEASKSFITVRVDRDVQDDLMVSSEKISEYSKVKKFREGDNEIEKLTEGSAISSSTIVSENNTETKAHEIRSEVTTSEVEKSPVRVEPSKSFITIRVDGDVQNDLMVSSEKISEYSKVYSEMKRTSTPVQKIEDRMTIRVANKFDDNLALVVQGRKVEEVKDEDSDMSQISVLTVKVSHNLTLETSHQVFLPGDPEVAKLRLEESLPIDLKANQAYCCSEVFVEVNKLSPTDIEDSYFTETLMYKPRQKELMDIVEEHEAQTMYNTMLKSVVERLSEFGELPSSGLEDIILTEEHAVKDSEVSVVVEQVSLDDSTSDLEFIIVKFQTSHGEKVWRYPQGDPELLDMVNAGIIPEDAIPAEFTSPKKSSGDEIVEIVLGEGKSLEKLYFRLDDPKLIEQVKGTDYEDEVMAMLEEAGISYDEEGEILEAPGLSHIHIRARKHKSVSDGSSDGGVSHASSESLLSEQEIEGMKVVLHTVNIEDKTDPTGKKYSLVTKVYLSEIGDKVEFEKRYESGSEKLFKLRKALPAAKNERGITYIDSIDIQPQFELPIPTNQKPAEQDRNLISDERSVSPVSRSLGLLQAAADEGENRTETWSLRAEEENNDNGERLIRIFDNHEGLNIETVHRADSPTILNLVSTGVIPESFCTTPVQDRSTEEVVQRKFQMKKREATDTLPQSKSSEVLVENSAIYIIRVEDIVEDYKPRVVLVTERLVDENGEEMVSQQVHRPDSPTMLALVDQGSIPAPFLLEEPEHEFLSEDPENTGNFVERVVKRVYERVNSEFVPFIPESSGESSDEQKLQFENFDPSEAEMNIHEVKLAEEKLKDNDNHLVHVWRQGLDQNGQPVFRTTRHRSTSPTVKRYKDEGKFMYDLDDQELNSKIDNQQSFQPYLSTKINPNNKFYELFSDKDWLSGDLPSQQSSQLLFLPDKSLSHVYLAVNVPFTHKNYLQLNSWEITAESDLNLRLSTVAIEYLKRENHKVIVLSRSLQDRKGTKVFSEIREFSPNSNLIRKLVEDEKLPRTVLEPKLSTSPIAMKLIEENLKHQKCSEKSEIVYETVKSTDPKRKVTLSSGKTPIRPTTEHDEILRAKLDEEFSPRGDKFLTVLQVRKIPNSKEVMEIRKYPPKCVFIDEIIKYNELPKTLQTPIPSQKSSHLILVPKSLWDGSLSEATSIESHERIGNQEKQNSENVFEVMPGQVPSSLQQRITEINIRSKKKEVTEKVSVGVDEPMGFEDPVTTDDFSQEVSILTSKVDESSKPSNDLISSEPITVSDEDQPQPSKFISSLMRKCDKLVVGDSTETPNSAPVSEAQFSIEDQPIALDVSQIVLTKAAQPSETEPSQANKRPSFYKDPLIKEVFPDLASQFDELPTPVQESILTRIETVSKKRKNAINDTVEEEVPSISAEIESLTVTDDFEMPCKVFSIVAEKNDDESNTVVMRREMNSQDAVESREYPAKTPFISSLVKEGKLFDVSEAEPSLNQEKEVEVPAVDWLASIGEVKTVSLVPSSAIQDNSSSMSSIGSKGYPYNSRVRMISLSGSPSDSFVTDLESGYESVTPMQTTTPPLDKDKLDTGRDSQLALSHADFRAIPTIAEESTEIPSAENDIPDIKVDTKDLTKPKQKATLSHVMTQEEESKETTIESSKELKIENEPIKLNDKTKSTEDENDDNKDLTRTQPMSTVSHVLPQEDGHGLDNSNDFKAGIEPMSLEDAIKTSSSAKDDIRDLTKGEPLTVVSRVSPNNNELTQPEVSQDLVHENIPVQLREKLEQEVIPVRDERPDDAEQDLNKVVPMETDQSEEVLEVLPKREKKIKPADKTMENDLSDLTKLDPESLILSKIRPVDADGKPEEVKDLQVEKESHKIPSKEAIKTEKFTSLAEVTPQRVTETDKCVEDQKLDELPQTPEKTKAKDETTERPRGLKIPLTDYPIQQVDDDERSMSDTSDGNEEPNVIDSIEKFQPIITPVDPNEPTSKLESFQPILKGSQTALEPHEEPVLKNLNSEEPQTSAKVIKDDDKLTKKDMASAEVAKSAVIPQSIDDDSNLKEKEDPSLMSAGVGFAGITEVPKPKVADSSMDEQRVDASPDGMA